MAAAVQPVARGGLRGGAAVFVALSIYLPAAQTAFETVTLDAAQAFVVLALSLLPFAVVELAKALGSPPSQA